MTINKLLKFQESYMANNALETSLLTVNFYNFTGEDKRDVCCSSEEDYREPSPGFIDSNADAK